MAEGAPAPDFTLPRLSDGEMVHLHDRMRARPVVLIFGSFGCQYFCEARGVLRKFYEEYKDRADFHFVYITDAHPVILPQKVREAKADPSRKGRPDADRVARVRAADSHYETDFPWLVDTADAKVEKAYDAFPAKLVIVDGSGRIALDSGPAMQRGYALPQARSWLGQRGRK